MCAARPLQDMPLAFCRVRSLFCTRCFLQTVFRHVRSLTSAERPLAPSALPCTIPAVALASTSTTRPMAPARRMAPTTSCWATAPRWKRLLVQPADEGKRAADLPLHHQKERLGSFQTHISHSHEDKYVLREWRSRKRAGGMERESGMLFCYVP